MNNERLIIIKEICDKYKHNNDYYSLFDLNPDMPISTIQALIKQKRLNVLFHPDQIGFIPEEYKQIFKIISDMIPDVLDVFSSYQSKEKYDKKLEEKKQKEENPELELQQAIINNAKKYGWESTFCALKDYMQSGYLLGFTRSYRVRETIKKIGYAKLTEIISSSSYGDLTTFKTIDNNQIIMNYITEIFEKNSGLKRKMNCLIDACNETYRKYDKYQVEYAITEFATVGNPNAFTSTNNARSKIKENIKQEEIEFMLLIELNKKRLENKNYAYSYTKKLNLEKLTSYFVKEIIVAQNTNNRKWTM